MTFFFLLLGISLIPCLFLLPALINRLNVREVDRKQVNVDISRQRAQDLAQSGDADSDAELQAALLEDLQGEQQSAYRRISTVWAVPVIALVPVAGFIIYGQIGNPEQAIGTQTVQQEPSPGQPHDIGELLERLEQTIAQNPDNPQGWALAARTYMTLEDYPKAELAYAQLNRLVNDNADYLTGWADAMIMNQGRVFTEPSRQLIDQALEIDPQHVNGLWLAGLGAESLGNQQQAVEYFQRLMPLIAGDAQSSEQVQQLIDRNLSQVSMQTSQENLADSATQQDSAAKGLDVPPVSREIQVQVSISKPMEQTLTGNETLFVFARAASGPRVPLAVSRHQASELPLQIALNADMAMMPNMSIDDFDDLVIAARISNSGDAVQKSGDLISNRVEVSTEYDGETLVLLIDQVVE